MASADSTPHARAMRPTTEVERTAIEGSATRGDGTVADRASLPERRPNLLEHGRSVGALRGGPLLPVGLHLGNQHVDLPLGGT